MNELYPRWALDLWKFLGSSAVAYLIWGLNGVLGVMIVFGVLSLVVGFIQEFKR